MQQLKSECHPNHISRHLDKLVYLGREAAAFNHFPNKKQDKYLNCFVLLCHEIM